MLLMETPKRKRMDELLEEGSSCSIITEALKRWDEIGRLDGIQILKRQDWMGSRHFLCAQYVFRECLKEFWCSNDARLMDSRLWDDTLNFLQEKGYATLPKYDLRERDVVGYKKNHGIYKGQFRHWGIVRDGLVASKFAGGHVFLHAIEDVPVKYADEAVFFRKTI